MRETDGRGFDVVGVGYTALDYLGMIPSFPRENHKLEMREFTVQGGGPCATAMVTASRLGLSTSFVGKVGDDYFGDCMLDELRREGVDISSVTVQAGKTSQFAFIMVDERSAARTILWSRGSVDGIGPADIDADLISGSGVLLVDSMEPFGGAEAARIARENSVPVVFDAGTLREGVKELLPLCDYIIASEVFADQISGGGDVEEALDAIYSYSGEAAVITLGERGCVALSSGGMMSEKGFELDAVDTTGAGDVFHGAFLYAILAGWDLRKACIFSNAVAGLKCLHLGGRAGIPGIEEVMSFLERQRPEIEFGN